MRVFEVKKFTGTVYPNVQPHYYYYAPGYMIHIYSSHYVSRERTFNFWKEQGDILGSMLDPTTREYWD